MALNVMEVAVFALVMLGANPEAFTCETTEAGARCSHGLAAFESSNNTILFSNGVRVVKPNRNSIVFSNGISTTHMDSAGWLQFSNGIGVRRQADGRSYRFSNDMGCVLQSPNQAACGRIRR
jgi:hypothetical protein